MEGLATGLLLLRLLTGVTFAAHGSQKLLGMFEGGGLDGTGRWLESIGFRPARLQALLAGAAGQLSTRRAEIVLHDSVTTPSATGDEAESIDR